MAERMARRWRPTPFIAVSVALHAFCLVIFAFSPRLWPWLLGLIVANHAVIMLLGLWPRSHWLGSNWTRLPATSAARGEIALTIDDGPDPVVTPQVLALLDRHGVRATFFCIGEQAERYPELCREIVRRGHAVENHSQRHRHHFSLLGPAGYRREIAAAQQTLSRITGVTPLFFRAPAGLRNPFLAPVLAHLDLQLASWSARGFDTRSSNTKRVLQRLLRRLRPGAILLLHDGNAAQTPEDIPVIVAVLPALLEHAAACKLRFVTLRQAAGSA